MANQLNTNLKSLAIKMITVGIKAISHLSLIAVAMSLLAGAVHGQTCQTSAPCTSGGSCCLFISSFHSQTVQLWKDDGSANNPTFTPGSGASEGLSCIQGSANLLYTSSYAENDISVYNLTTGAFLGTTSPFGAMCTTNPPMGGCMAALAANSAGSEIYAGQYAINTVLGLQPTTPANDYLTQFAQANPANSHDVAVGPMGHVFATQIADPQDTGVQEFDQNLVPIQQDLPGISPNHGSPCATFTDGSHCWHRISGMDWDNATPPNLWVSSDTSSDNGIFEFAVPPPGFNCGAPLCPLNFTHDPYNSNGDPTPIGLAVAPATTPQIPTTSSLPTSMRGIS